MAGLVGGLERRRIRIGGARPDPDADVITGAGDLRVRVARYSVRAHPANARKRLAAELAPIDALGFPLGELPAQAETSKAIATTTARTPDMRPA